jgi:MurNAc alpha-1-phosphate uridylyltransferase
MILAAGRGERLRPLTDTCPKPLITVDGKPLIEHALDRLAAAGVQTCVINLSWLGETIRDHLEAHWRWPMQCAFSDESERLLETGGGIFKALDMLGSAPFLLVNADVYCEFDLGELAIRARHWPAQCQAHLLLVDNPAQHPQGDFALNAQGRLQSSGPALTYSGLSILHPDLFQGQRPGRFALAPLLRQAIQEGAVTGAHYQGHWTDVGTPARLQELRQRLNAAPQPAH